MVSTKKRAVSRRRIRASAATAAGVRARSARAQGTGGKTFVLVHGAWHGGWCWRRIADRLERRGHKVFAPTMTGLGDRSHLVNANVTLETHVSDIVNVIKWEDLSDIVLVGHSYGGLIVSGVAEHMHSVIGAIVFLDAFVPENGDSILARASQPTREGIIALQQKGETLMPPISAAFFRVNERDRAWVDGKCTPHPIATFVDKISLTGARERVARKAYIRAKGYPSVPFDDHYQKLKSDSSWHVHELPCGHDAMVDMPDELTEILLAV